MEPENLQDGESWGGRWGLSSERTKDAVKDLPIQNREAILKRWVELTLATYPEEAVRAFAKTRDPFANPLGAAVRNGTQALFDLLVADADDLKLQAAADGIVRLRAVQNFSASEAVSFVFLLKTALRELMPAGCPELETMTARVDRLSLAAFNRYMQCREQVWKIHATELRKRTEHAMRRMNVAVEEYVPEPEEKPSRD
ncbi:MAG: hypothetical protein C4523_11435 [Myxococcales bacterium]|nr:MAG: hypothetical protein C4523_11435 [Myxococcales bacterium]